MLDLQARIHFQEIEVLFEVRVHQKLDGTGIVIVGSLCDADRDLAHAPAHFRIHQWRGRLLHHFLVTALDGTLAFTEINRVAVLVRQHLHLDVPGVENGFLQINFAVSESPLRLALCRFQRGLQLLRRTHQSHPFAAAARRRLQHDGIADVRRHFPGLLDGLQSVGSSRHERHAGLFHLLAGAGL